MPAAAHQSLVQNIVSGIMPHEVQQREQAAAVPSAAPLSAPSSSDSSVGPANYDKAYESFDRNGAAVVSFWHMVDLSQF
jgi:hypothetical protein